MPPGASSSAGGRAVPIRQRRHPGHKDREAEHGVRRAYTLVERDSRADDRNGEPDEERDQQLRGHRHAVLGRRPVEHEAGRPFEDGAGARADQAAAEEEQRKARGRKAHRGHEQHETDEHRDGAEREHARRLQPCRRELGQHPGREDDEQRRPCKRVRGAVEGGGEEQPGQAGEEPVGRESGQRRRACRHGKPDRERRSICRRRTRLRCGREADQRDRPERDPDEVGQRQRVGSPRPRGSRRREGRCPSAPTFTDVPIVWATTGDAFGSARRRSSMRYVIAVPAAIPTANR